MQETWLKLFEKHQRGELAQLELPGLAIRQALFIASDVARKTRAQATQSIEAQDDRTSPEPNPVDIMIARQELGAARGVIAGLPERQRTIFEWHFRNASQSHEATAAALQISVQHLRQTLCDIRKQVRKIVQGPPRSTAP